MTSLSLLCLFLANAQPPQDPLEKLGPHLRMLAGGDRAAAGRAQRSLVVKPAGPQRREPAVSVFMRFQGDAAPLVAALEAIGASVGTVVGNLATAEIPVPSLMPAAALPNIVAIEASRPVRPKSDVSVPATGANQVWYGAGGPVDHTNTTRGPMPPPWTGNTGQGALVGVVDTGVDLTHRDFMDFLGNTRLVSVWDQTALKGTPPQAVTMPAGYPAFKVKGNECSSAQINAIHQKFDLAVTNYSDNTMSTLLGDGVGGLGTAATYAKGHLPVAVAAADFDRDGNIDLVTGNLDGTITWVQGNGHGGFTPQPPTTVVNNTQVTITFVVAADLNDDGFPDVVAVLNDASAVAVLYGNGDGTFNPPGVLPKGDPASGYFLSVGNSPSSAAVADLNGDGRPDLVVTNYMDSTVSVFLNLGNGQFAEAPGQPFAVSNVAPSFPNGAFPSYVAIADFNGDGVPDLAIASWGRGGGAAPGNNVSIMLGKGDGTFQAPATTFTDHFELAVVAGDFNGDGKQDLAFQSYSGSVSVLLGHGDGTFATQVDYSAGGTVGLYTGQATLALGDFNQDGILDIANLVRGGGGTNPYYDNVAVLLGKGDGTFGSPTLYPTGSQGNSTSLAAGNFHGTVCSEVDTEGHGTMVSGIAAGNGSAGGAGLNQTPYRYMGMAPEAGLIMVKTSLNSADIVNAVAYIAHKADTLGLPVAINLSLGQSTGPHDGTSSYETMLSGLAGPGKVIVAAMGNDGDLNLHVDGTVPSGHQSSVNLAIAGGVTQTVFLDLWYPGQDHFGIDVFDPNGSDCLGAPKFTPGVPIDFVAACGNGDLTIYSLDAQNGDNEVLITLSNSGNPLTPGNWTIQLDGFSCLSDVCVTKGTYDLWASSPCSGCAQFAPGADGTYSVDAAKSINEPATANELIAAGSYVTKVQWNAWGAAGSPLGQDTGVTVAGLSNFSSLGPTRKCSNGACTNPVQKPDVAAPGEMITSAYAAGTSVCVFGGSCLDPDAQHIAGEGTSFAAPHVTGGVALMLAAHPSMTPCQVKASLSHARPDPNTGPVPNNSWGYGKLAIDLAIAAPLVQFNIPNVVGLSLNAAVSAIVSASLRVGSVIYASNAAIPAGNVISQTPPAGQGCGAVNLLVSGIAVPDVAGDTRTAATTAIGGANLAVGQLIASESTTQPAGKAITSSPAAGTLVGPGTSVDIYFSGIPVPNVVGQSNAAAQAAITGAQLTVGTVTRQSSQTVPAGDVISEDPIAHTLLVPGAPVNLVVSGIQVPDVVGQAQAAGEGAITGASLTVGNVSYASSNTIAPGKIISENPAAGTFVSAGSAVALVVSGVTVPGEVGQAVDSAEAAITGAQLAVGNVSQVVSNAAAGSVVSQSPAAGTVAAVGSAVDLTVSGGPTGQIKVPNVVGSTQANAATAIQNAGLVVGTVTSATSATVPAGSVISEAPAAGTAANAGSPVNLVVSVGAAGPQSIQVTPANPTVAAGLAEQFTATGIYAGNVRQDLTAQVTWASATKTVATVSAGGLASTLATGSSTISATLGGVTGSTLLTAAPPGACDVDGNGLQGVSDVQSAINQALGMAPSSGGANVASVQVVLNATLSLGCTTH